MFLELFNHFRLIWRLANDKRVDIWLKWLLIIIPLIYVISPFPFDDLIPIFGLLDDLLLFTVTSIIFKAMCPKDIVYEHEMALKGEYSSAKISNIEDYRYVSEIHDLAVSFISTILLLLLGGYLIGMAMFFLFGLSYYFASLKRGETFANMVQINKKQLPQLYKIFQETQEVLPSVKVNLFVYQDPKMNAYTFGYNEPYSIVLTSGLIDKFTEPEIRSVIGHEMGHILFGHVSIMSIINLQAGLSRIFFYKWSRSCEYSADAIALLVSEGDIVPVVSSLMKLTSGLSDTIDIEAFLEQVDKDFKMAASEMELFSTHPFVNNRIEYLLQLSNSELFKR